MLTSLFHHFKEPGDYEFFIQQGEKVVHRAYVKVSAEQGPVQIDVDLSSSATSKKGCCNEVKPYELKVNGVIGFYASQGAGKYTVRVIHLGEKEKTTLLDSRKAIPEGDVFAVTLAQPGVYRVTTSGDKGESEIRVSMPTPKDGKYRPDQPILVELGKESARPKPLQIMAGQTVVYLFKTSTSLHVELSKEEKPTRKPRQAPHYTKQQSSPKQVL